MRNRNHWIFAAGLTLGCQAASALTLPENRADTFFHYYSGDDVTVGGPALLVRKDVLEDVSVNASYYVDSISSASVDVRTYASQYADERTQYGMGMDYLYKDATISLNFSNSEENDYSAKTYDVGVSHETFGGMTTVSIGYNRGYDTVRKYADVLKEDVDRNGYRLGLAQVLTPTWLVTIGYEGIIDDGFLRNPYRAALIAQGTSLPAVVEEQYPRTRASHAVSMQGKKLFPGFMPIAVGLSYRYFFDTWDISANTLELIWSQRLSPQLTYDVHGRYYRQSSASFFADVFDQRYLYMARDKELSTFSDYSTGFKISYEFKKAPWRFIDRISMNLALDLIQFEYDDFYDRSKNLGIAEKFGFRAEVLQLFLSAWY